MVGLAFALIVVAGVFQDQAADIFGFVLCGVILAAGFLLLLAGIFYEKNKNIDIMQKIK